MKYRCWGRGEKGRRKEGKAVLGTEEKSMWASEPWPLIFPDGPKVDASLWKLSGPTQTSVGQKLPYQEGNAQLGIGPGRICREQGPWVEQEGSTQRSRRWPLLAVPIIG